MALIKASALLTFTVILLFTLASANEAKQLLEAEECEAEQYFDARDAKCHNCSEVGRLFDESHSPIASWQHGQEWQAVPAAAAKLPSIPGLVRLPQDKNSRQQQQAPSRPIPNRINPANNNSVLSRLISSNVELEEREEEEESGAADQVRRDDREGDSNQFRRHHSSAIKNQDQPLAGDGDGEGESSVDESIAGSRQQQQRPVGDSSSYALLLLFPLSTDTQISLSEISSLTRLQTNILSRFVFTSKQIQRNALEAIGQCRQNQLASACQQWSNMCALNMYAHSDAASSASTAGAGSPSARSATLTGDIGRGQKWRGSGRTAPLASSPRPSSWQRCAHFSLNSLCNSLRDWHRLEKPANSELSSIYLEGAANSEEPTLDSPDLAPKGTQISLKLSQLIQLIAYKYSFDGRLMEVSQFDLNDMSGFSCATLFHRERPATGGRSEQQAKVGQNFHNHCQVNLLHLSEFVDTRQHHLNGTVFYDLFIGHSSSSGTFIKPVPILIKNLLYNNQLTNLKHARDSSRWRLVRRFFFNSLDQISLDDQQPDSHLLFTFVRSANLELKFRKHQERGGFLLSSILLHLDYGQYVTANQQQRPTSNNWTSEKLAAQAIESHVTLSQTLLDMQGFRKDLDLLITILCILSCLWSLIKCYNIRKYHGVIKLDIYSLITFLILSCDIVGNLMALVSLLFAVYLFSLFKLNTLFNTNNNNWQLFAPSAEMEQALLLNVKLAFLFKFLGFAYKLYVRLNVDLFFIDWERPKMWTSMQILQHYHMGSNPKDSRPNDEQPAAANQQQQTSFWRPYTVVNRWIQLLTLRRCSLSGQLIVFLCLMEASELLDQWTSMRPLKGTSRTPTIDLDPGGRTALVPSGSLIFRALILALVYLSLALAQYLYKRLLHEPMFSSATDEFVDLCSVANVSVFAMLYPRYGYYIHGRNANGSGDCGLLEMNALLEREERELCSKRGLAPNSDHQTFVMILPRIINDHYRKLLWSYSAAGGAGLRTTSHLSTSANLLRSALSLAQSNASLSGSASGRSQSIVGAGASSSLSSRALVETIVARNKAINLFLTNFLDHIYKDIDYSIREQRPFEGLLLMEDENEGSQQEAGGPSAATNGGSATPTMAATSECRATFCLDRSAKGFTSLLLLGLELDLIACELFCLLILDACLGPQRMTLTVGLIWLASKLFSRFYLLRARENLISKSMLDEKFLFGTRA